MFSIHKTETTHDMEKQNLVTKSGKIGKKSYLFDEYKCRLCGVRAKSSKLTEYDFDSRLSMDTAKNCKMAPKTSQDEFIGQQVKVTRCTASGKAFSNLTPQSVHSIVKPPEEYHNSWNGGVWIMGVGEPVKLLSNEFLRL